MSTIDQQFVEYIVKSLVGNPDAVAVERTIDERGVLLQLTVAEDDLGRVIGKRGSTAQSIRTLLRALGTKNDARYNLKIIDPTGGSAPRSYDDNPRDESQSFSGSDAPAPVAAVSDDQVAVADEPVTAPQDSGSALADKTRKELAELDDLDI